MADAAILSLSEACEILHVDAGTNDDLIQSLVAAIPGFIYQTTGMLESEQLSEPIAKTAAGFLLTLWYYADHTDDLKLQRTIDSLLKCITLKARVYDTTA